MDDCAFCTVIKHSFPAEILFESEKVINRKIVWRSVFHLHMHVTPRHANDNMRFILQLKS